MGNCKHTLSPCNTPVCPALRPCAQSVLALTLKPGQPRPRGFKTLPCPYGSKMDFHRRCPSHTVHGPKPQPGCPCPVSRATSPTRLANSQTDPFTSPGLPGCFHVYDALCLEGPPAPPASVPPSLVKPAAAAATVWGGMSKTVTHVAGLLIVASSGLSVWLGAHNMAPGFQEGSSKSQCSTSQDASREASSDLALDLRCGLLVKPVPKTSPAFRGQDLDSTCQGEG